MSSSNIDAGDPSLQSRAAGHPAVDPQRLRQALGRFASGVTVLTASSPLGVHGMTASAFMSGSLEPPLVVVSIGRRTKLHGLIDANGAFGINILSDAQETHSRRFSGQASTTCEPVFVFHHGIPVLEGALASIAATVEDRYGCGDHSLYLGRVQHLTIGDGQPLLHYCSGYHRLL